MKKDYIGCMNYKMNIYTVIIYLIIFALILTMLIDYFSAEEKEKVTTVPKVKKVEVVDTSHTYIYEKKKKVEKKRVYTKKYQPRKKKKVKKISVTKLRKQRLLKQRIINDNDYCQNNVENTYKYYNKIRTDSKMIPFKRNEVLEQAATNHAEYLYKNFEYIPHDLTLHNEDDSFVFFTGVKSSDRAISAGHNTKFVSEGIAFTDSAKNSIDGLMTAIYHRYGILDFFMDEVGLSNYIVSNNCMFSFVHNPSLSTLDELCLKDLNVSSNNVPICKEGKTLPRSLFNKSALDIAKQNPKYVLYPPANGKDIIRKFYGEIPDPMPDKKSTANPISIQFNRYYYPLKSVEMISFRVHDLRTRKLLDGRVLKKDPDPTHNPNGLVDENEYAFFAFDIFEAYRKYRVQFTYKFNGVKQNPIVWTFTTNHRDDYRKN